MKPLLFAIVGLPAALLILPENLSAHAPTVQEMAAASKAFIKSLDKAQLEKVHFDWKNEERFNWHYIPRERKGLPLKELTPAQRHLAYGLLVTGLSHKGYRQALEIMSLEQILFELENENPGRDTVNYYISFFGTPEPEETWGWRFEGHHLSLNYTVVKGKAVSVTPSFFATNPGEVKEGPRAGLWVLRGEEEKALNLINSLTDEQKQTAVFSEKAPADIITTADRKVSPLEPKGIAYASLNEEQRNALRDLIHEYLGKHRPALAEEAVGKIEKAGWDNVHLAWAGGMQRGVGHYYRIQGPTFLLEYDNIQNNANHVHAVWRDFDGDFGEDILKQHYDENH